MTLGAHIVRSCRVIPWLVTGRERLETRGELTYRVPSPTGPWRERRSADAETMSRYEGVRLFVERAKLVRSAST